MWIPLRTALGFLTIVPVGGMRHGATPEQWGHSALYYPIVGLLLGGVLWLVVQLLGFVPVTVQAALLVTVWVLVTGFLHLDGLSDVADALLGGHGDNEKILRILKDVHCGTAGVAAIVLVLLLKTVAVNQILVAGPALAVVLAPVLGRTFILVMILTTPYAREEGIGLWLNRHLPKAQAIGMVVAVAVLTVIGLGWAGLGLVFLVGILAWVGRFWLLRTLGGYTGDFVGAFCEIIETICLLFFSMLLKSPAL